MKEEKDRVMLEAYARPLGDIKEATRRAQWEIQRKNAAHDEWVKAIGSGASAEIESANRYGERIDEEIKEQNKAWAAEDEKNRDRREMTEKERHRDALAAIDRSFYTHFGLIWLLITGVLLALAGWMANSGPRVAARATDGAPPGTPDVKTDGGEQKFWRCPCQKCGVTIEFPVDGIGETVTCPKCGAETLLSSPV